MNYFLDTNICVYLLNGKFPRLTEKFLTYQPREIKIPSTVIAELVYGANKSQKQVAVSEQLKKFLVPFESVPFDTGAAFRYGEIRASLEKMGQVIGPNDLIIAATVLSRGGILVTNNTKEFSRIQQLMIEDWTVSR